MPTEIDIEKLRRAEEIAEEEARLDAEYKRPNPRSVRLGAEQNAIVERIITKYSPPGFPLSYNAALKIALAFWAEQNPEAV